MNRVRYDILRQAFGPGARAAQVTLFLVAKEHGVAVDDIVQAALGRGATSEGAKAAQAIKAKVPDFFKPLEAAWPFVCGACKADVSRVNVCAECQTSRVCDTCLGRYGCPPCAAKTEAGIARKQTATADMEANAKWLKRQLAQPLSEEEDDVGLPAHPPAPPPDPPEPPNRVERESRENVPGMVPEGAPRRAYEVVAVAEDDAKEVDSGA